MLPSAEVAANARNCGEDAPPTWDNRLIKRDEHVVQTGYLVLDELDLDLGAAELQRRPS
jgi:hypothetical protein